MNLKNPIKVSVYFIVVIYSIQLVNFILPIDLGSWGIYPRTLHGLRGILFSPVLHGGWAHLISNTVPVFVLLLLTFSFYSRVAVRTVIISVLLSGLLTWIIGRSAYHIGASSLIYALAAFLVTYGVYKRKVLPLLLSAVVAFLYGGLVWGILPVYDFISWEGHLSGAIAGVVAAYYLRNEEYE